MRTQLGKLGILSCVALLGCGEAPVDDAFDDEGEVIAEAEQTLETSNMLSANALDMNALDMNALDMNALDMNALDMNALDMNGLSSAFNDTTPAAVLSHGTRGELSEELFRYIYGCAMPSNMSMQVPVVRNGESKVATFQGSLGLAPQWATGPCDTACQQWVSACVLARVNAYHVPIKISLRGNHPALTTTQAEIDSYPIFEGRFYGNIFDRSTLQSPMNACYGSGASMGHITSRACAKGGGYCTMNVTGDCSTQCNAVNGTCTATTAGNSSASIPAIEVWLATPATSACGNGVCEAGETQATCLFDCAPAGVVDHEPAGTSATTMVSAPLNASNVVYAGITTSTSSLLGLSLDTGAKTSRDMFIIRGNADGTYGAMRRIAMATENPIAMDASATATGSGNIALATMGTGEGTLYLLNASTLATNWSLSLYSASSGYRIDSVKVEGTSYVHTLGTLMSLSGGVWIESGKEYRKYNLSTGTVASSRTLSLALTSPSVTRMASNGSMRSVRASATSTLELRTYGPPGQTNLDSTVSLPVSGFTNIVPKGMEEGVFVAGNGTTSGGQSGAFIGRVYAGNSSWAWMNTLSPDPDRSVEIYSMQLRGQVVIVTGKFKGPFDFRGSVSTMTPSARAGVNGNEDIFVAAYEVSTGALSWVRTYGGPGVDIPDASTMDETGRLWLFGRFVGTPRIEGTYVAGRDGDVGVDSMRVVAGPLSMAQSAPIGAGAYASYAVRDGQLWAWGMNVFGGLGLPQEGTVSAPTVALTGVVKAAASLASMIALRADGTVWVAGDNSAGQFGNGTWTSPPVWGTWAQVPGLSGIVDIAAGVYHVLALKSNGNVYSWGNNQSGQLGLGNLNNKNVPTLVPLSGATPIAVGAQHSSSGILRADGTVLVFGGNNYGNLDPVTPGVNIPSPVVVPGMSDIIALAIGSMTVMGLRRDGTVWIRGNNANGNLGNGTTTATTSTIQVPSLTDVISISNGAGFSAAARRNGTVWAWGLNDGGQLGDGTTINRPTPIAVSGATGIVQVTSGISHTAMRNEKGDMGGFGGNTEFQISGTAATVALPATRIAKLSDATSIYASRNSAFVVRNSDILRSCGTGALGDASVKMRPYFESVFGLSNMKQAASGLEHGLGVSNTGTVYVWGRNAFGQLGDGTRAERPSPKLLSSLSGISKVAAGDYFSMALASSGTAYTFGDNSSLTLGVSSVTTSSAPIALTGFGTVTDIAAGDVHGLLVNSTGQLYAWGNDSYGQLGRGTVTATNQLPQLVTGLSGVTMRKVAAAENHTMALDSLGRVWNFGNDSYGQLGRGTTAASRPAPAMLAGISGATAIATSARHSLILRADGTVLAMGNNSSGQLGDGTTTSRLTPTVVPGLSNVIAIAAGDSHSMVLKSDGTVWTFGSRANGQLCDGKNQGNALTPVQTLAL